MWNTRWSKEIKFMTNLKTFVFFSFSIIYAQSKNDWCINKLFYNTPVLSDNFTLITIMILVPYNLDTWKCYCSNVVMFVAEMDPNKTNINKKTVKTKSFSQTFFLLLIKGLTKSKKTIFKIKWFVIFTYGM